MRARLCSVVLLCILAGCSCGPPRPGEDEFQAASQRINSGPLGKSDKPRMLGSGVTESERARADAVAQILTTLDRQLFSGHDEGHSISFTGEFLVYCRHSAAGVVFLIHAPQFKRYQDDVRDTLLRAAWAAAVAATEDLASAGSLQLGVGLRGSMNYGAIAFGRAGEEPTIELGESLDPGPLFPFFVGPVAEEAKSAPSREVEAAPAPVVAPAVPKAPPRMQVRALFTKHRDLAEVAAEVLAHEESQRCAATMPEGATFDYFVEIKADGRVKELSYADLNTRWPGVKPCMPDVSKAWRFRKGKSETARIRVGYQSDPLP